MHSCSSDTLRPRLASLLPADVHEDFKHLPEVPEATSEDAGELEETPEEQESEAESEDHAEELHDTARAVVAELRKLFSKSQMIVWPAEAW